MNDKQLSSNFWFSEFKYVEPDPRLLYILQWLRDKTNNPVTITDSARTIKEHLNTYLKLENEGKIPTVGNGKGNDTLWDKIPWSSRHLPTFKSRYLRAVDINAEKDSSDRYSGLELYDLVMECIRTPGYLDMLNELGYDSKSEGFVGTGIGKTFLHLDIDRSQNTKWGYAY